jgi:histidine phosphotransferase ChpT
MHNGLRLAELLADRLCHDLSGPLNAMQGAAEVATDDAAMAGEAMGIVMEATQLLVRRLRLLRAAWGTAAPLSSAEFVAFAEGLATRRLAISTEHLDPWSSFSAEGARLALNALLLAVGAVGGNGRLTIGGNPDGDVVFRIEGPRAAWPIGFIGLLAEPDQAWAMLDDPSRLQGPLTVLLAQAAGLGISVLLGPKIEAAPPIILRLGAS